MPSPPSFAPEAGTRRELQTQRRPLRAALLLLLQTGGQGTGRLRRASQCGVTPPTPTLTPRPVSRLQAGRRGRQEAALVEKGAPRGPLLAGRSKPGPGEHGPHLLVKQVLSYFLFPGSGVK